MVLLTMILVPEISAEFEARPLQSLQFWAPVPKVRAVEPSNHLGCFGVWSAAEVPVVCKIASLTSHTGQRERLHQ